MFYEKETDINAAKELCKTTNACGLMLETAKANQVGNSLVSKNGVLRGLRTHLLRMEFPLFSELSVMK